MANEKRHVKFLAVLQYFLYLNYWKVKWIYYKIHDFTIKWIHKQVLNIINVNKCQQKRL